MRRADDDDRWPSPTSDAACDRARLGKFDGGCSRTAEDFGQSREARITQQVGDRPQPVRAAVLRQMPDGSHRARSALEDEFDMGRASISTQIGAGAQGAGFSLQGGRQADIV